MSAEAVLTHLEAAHIISNHRLHTWPTQTVDVPGLIAVTRGLPETLVHRVLDDWNTRNDVPPTPHQITVLIDRVIAADRITHIRQATRQQLTQQRPAATPATRRAS